MKPIIWLLLSLFIFFDCKSQELVPFRSDSLWGYKDNQGVVKIEAQFQYATKFMYNFGIVAERDKLGAINKNNNQIISFRYEFLRPLDSTEFLFGYKTKYFGEYTMGVITKDETVKIPALYSYISKKNNTYTIKQNLDSIIGKSGINDIRSIKSYYGLLDINGNTLIQCKYDYLSWVNDSLLVITTGGSGTSQALFNKQGKQLTGFEYRVFGEFIEGMAKARIANKYGFIYPTGKVAIPINFEYCENFNNGYALIKQGEKWGAINKKGEIVIKPNKTYQEVIAELKEN